MNLPASLQKLRLFACRYSPSLYKSSPPPPPSIWSPNLISRAISTRIQSIFSAEVGVLSAPWCATQLRPKYCGSDVRPGNVIERKGRIYQVVKALHRTPGKGAALIQVELRDVDSGNKVNERLRTDEAIENGPTYMQERPLWKEHFPCGYPPLIEQYQQLNDDREDNEAESSIFIKKGVYVEQKTFTYLYTDEETDSVVLMEPNTFVQMDVPKSLFGESFVYLKDNMSVTVELYDDKPMSASVPQRVTCTVVETQAPVKGIGATPHNKKAILDNGLTIQVPAHILTGDHILIDTIDNSYMSRA